MQNRPEGTIAEWEMWVASRPPQIQRAARAYPPGSVIEHAGEILWLIGYNETTSDEVMLIFSKVNPFEDYEAAHRPENRCLVCEHHLAPMNPKYVE
jgi:hypothetical protein